MGLVLMVDFILILTGWSEYRKRCVLAFLWLLLPGAQCHGSRRRSVSFRTSNGNVKPLKNNIQINDISNKEKHTYFHSGEYI